MPKQPWCVLALASYLRHNRCRRGFACYPAGFDLIYEARDLDLAQNVRDGMTQARTDLDATKKRVKESEARIDAALEPSIAKAYW
jgi:hypothetical protein